MMLQQVAEAKRAVSKVLELDKERRFPRAELIMGNILRAEGDIARSAEHLRRYVQLDPTGRDVPNVQAYLDDLAKANANPAPKPN